MKKLILFLTLFSFLSIQAQVSTGKEQEFETGIKNNASQTVTTPINVVTQGSDGTLGKTLAGNLIEVLEYSTASAMPVTGVSGKIYVTIDSGRLYRWNGTVYNEISTGGVTSVSGINGVTVTNPTTTPIIGLGDITPTTVTTNSTTLTPVTAPSYAEGKVFYDNTAKTLVAYDDISGTSTNLGQELNLRARNNTGVTITNGSVVYISGATGQNPTIALARANSLLTSVTIGIATHDIANNTIGKITTFGLVNDLNTSAFTDGQILYVSPTTAGALTATVPSSPNYTAHVCVVLHSHITQGKIFVRPEQPISLNTALTDNNNTSPSVSAVKSYIDTGFSSKIGGSGTVGALPVFTASGVLGNSIISENSGIVTVSGSATGAGTVFNIVNAASNQFLGFGQFLSPNMIAGQSSYLAFGKVASLYNRAGISYSHSGDGSSANSVSISFFGADNILNVNAAKRIMINTTTDNGIDQIQVPNGTISALPATLSNQVVVKSQLDLKANIVSPTFTGVPSAPTAVAGTNTTQIASTAFVISEDNWSKSGSDIVNKNTGNILINGGSSVSRLSLRMLENDRSAGISFNTAFGTDWRIFASDFGAVQNGNGSFAGFHLGANGASGSNDFWIGGFNSTVSNSFQSPSNTTSATIAAFRGVTGQTGDYLQVRSNRTVLTGDVMSVNSLGLAIMPIATNGLITAESTGKVLVTKDYVSSNSPKQLKDFYSDVNNIGITETDLYSYTTPAGRLNSAGEKIISVYAGTMNDVTASSQLKAYFAGTLIADTGALTMSVTGAWVINASIIRTGATTARSIVNISTPGASTASYTKYTSISGLTFTNTNIIKVTGTAAGATGGDNDITATYGNIIWQPAAL